ncbi:MAG TPA: putative Ig domain-containing protein [Candidatus Sulfopaludibacter sp.]|jgi:uncharacterized protein (TIGR03437 family)|nr:putative Ig domain-containing protein [Candidatus Sulfopaludibacter sp.]
MNLSDLRRFSVIAILGALALSGLQAANLLTATPATVSLTCNTLTGPGAPATIVVKAVANLTNSTIAVTLGSLNTGLVVTAPPVTVLDPSNQSQGIAYTVNAAPGCTGPANGTLQIKFNAGSLADVPVTINTSVVATASALVASPVVLTCSRNAGPPVLYSPGVSQKVVVTSAAAGGTPFTVDTASLPSWLAVSPTTGGIAGAAGLSLNVASVAPCGNYAAGSTNATSIRLRNAPAPDALIPVSLQVLGSSLFSITPASPLLSYTKGAATPAAVDVTVSAPSSVSAAFTIDAASLPSWLTADLLKGSAPSILHFTTTGVADTLAPGAYSAAVHVQAAGFADLIVSFRLSVANPSATLNVAEGTARHFDWTIGQAVPIPYITLTSSGTPLPYSISTAGPLAPIIAASLAKGYVYSYPTPIPVTFDPNIFAAAQAGSVLTGTVTVTWGTPAATTVITLSVAVLSAPASLLGVSPASLPAAAAGETLVAALSGTGFVASSDATQRTVVGIVSGGLLVADANLSAMVVNSSNIVVTITVPAVTDPLLPFASSGTFALGVCNPIGTGCTVPTGSATLTVGARPVVQAVTSASSYVQVAAPALPVVAPYDMISLFGFNFCTSAGTGCGDTVLYAALDPVTLRYPTSLSPDAAGAGRRLLTVTFQTQAVPPVVIASAPLFFATDSQINLVAPSGLAAFVGKSVDIVVNFGASAGIPFPVNVAAVDPGIFAVGAGGQGDGAILGQDWTVISSDNPAAMRQTAADSDIVQIFATGLGAPDSTADNAASGSGAWSNDCVSTSSFLNSLNLKTSSTLTSVDGSLVASGLLNTGRLAPCLRSSTVVPSVTIGGQTAVVTYAGWVQDSIAGLYQVNVRLPGSAGPLTLAAPTQLPVVLTARGRSSQAGVTIWVAPKLKVAWSAASSSVLASQGTAPYRFAVSGGVLPAGLTLDTASGAISGTPSANSAGSYPVTVTATDSAATPLTGSISFVLAITASH